ncbi:PREDICTED: uncharacterized protein LOC105359790 [Ceratosolen solmsi marchali]|uniref:Uncharacterized protein LOC105359790 n=1 Tax=Ceratosolen solmsi marchali TaxID=326594 RepID=A0AAJ6VLR5_9HYME|nr:PREDICTED: uncharacterized protein LOC105359790 [Ceratosolen solmsi marchali]
MVGRAFSVKVDLDLHAVSCPGVWLCPVGKVSVQINIFDSCTSTPKLTSVFPLLYHNKLIFKKVFTGVTTLAELQKKLSEEYISVELIQWSTLNKNICLATFEANLVDVLYPVPCFKGLLAGVDIDLLMEPTKFFPGILSPKLEISTRTTIEEFSDVDSSAVEAHIINPKTINSMNPFCVHKKKALLSNRQLIRQKKVCHTGQEKVNTYVCRLCRRLQNNTKVDHNCNPPTQLHSTDKCYLSSAQKRHTCKSLTNNSQKSHENDNVCNDVHVLENCPICLKYQCYFSKKKPKSDNQSNSCNVVVHKKPYNKYIENRTKFTNEFNCDHTHENCDKKVSKLSNTIHSLHLEKGRTNNEDINHHCCASEICKNSSNCQSYRAPTIKDDSTMSILLAKIKQLEKTKEKLNYADCADRDSCYTTSNNNNESNEVRKGYYKNLEKFYKKMYKQAKQRAHDLDES